MIRIYMNYYTFTLSTYIMMYKNVSFIYFDHNLIKMKNAFKLMAFHIIIEYCISYLDLIFSILLINNAIYLNLYMVYLKYNSTICVSVIHKTHPTKMFRNFRYTMANYVCYNSVMNFNWEDVHYCYIEME